MPAPDDVALKEYLEMRLAEMDLRLRQRFEAQEGAAAAALQATEKALSAALLAAKESAAADLEATRTLAARSVQLADQKSETHNQIWPRVQTLMEGVNGRITSVEEASEKRDTAIEQRVARFENREEGMSLTTKLVIGAVGFLATILGIVGSAVGLYLAFAR